MVSAASSRFAATSPPIFIGAPDRVNRVCSDNKSRPRLALALAVRGRLYPVLQSPGSGGQAAARRLARGVLETADECAVAGELPLELTVVGDERVGVELGAGLVVAGDDARDRLVRLDRPARVDVQAPPDPDL